jgi:hypothetical protein
MAVAVPPPMRLPVGSTRLILSMRHLTTESMSVSSRIGSYKRTPGLRLRPLPELGTCLAFVPEEPRLYTLNLHAWLVLELCEYFEAESLVEEYLAAASNKVYSADPEAELERCIKELMDIGILAQRPR